MHELQSLMHDFKYFFTCHLRYNKMCNFVEIFFNVLNVFFCFSSQCHLSSFHANYIKDSAIHE